MPVLYNKALIFFVLKLRQVSSDLSNEMDVFHLLNNTCLIQQEMHNKNQSMNQPSQKNLPNKGKIL